MAESIKHKTFRASLWRFLEVGGRQLINLIVSTVIARLVIPSQFGLVAMLAIFIALSEVFIDSGFSTALIRDTKRSHCDCSTVFYFNILISVVCFAILVACAPLIASFYEMPELTPITRVVAISLIIIGFSSVQRSLLVADMNFKRLAAINLIALILSGIVGIVLAYKGFQVWALVIQTILQNLIATSLMWIRSVWYPAWEFSWTSFKKYFTFGSSLLGAAVLETLYKNSFSMVIGKFFSSATLAFYNRGWTFTNTASAVPTSIIESVTFPALCRLQDEKEKLRDGYRRLIRLSAFVVFPLCMGLGAVAYPFINVLLTDRWIFAATIMKIVVFGMMLYPIHSLNLNLLKVCGKTNLFLRLEVYKKIAGVLILCATVPFGIIAMCYGTILSSVVSLVINTWYTGKLINVSFLRQMWDVMPIFLLSVAMFAAVSALCNILGNGILSLTVGIIAGVAVYLAGAVIFRFTELKEVRNLHR